MEDLVRILPHSFETISALVLVFIVSLLFLKQIKIFGFVDGVHGQLDSSEAILDSRLPSLDFNAEFSVPMPGLIKEDEMGRNVVSSICGI